MLTHDCIDKILEACRIEEVVSDFVSLRKRGVNYVGICPFHDDNNPSMYVSPAKGIFKCFVCDTGGDSVGFIMKHEKLSYTEALKYLANKYSIPIEEVYTDENEKNEATERESLYAVAGFAQKFFTETLNETEEGRAIGLSYFKERGFSADTIRKFGLGYADKSFHSLAERGKKEGYDLELFVKTGLLKKKDDGSYYDMIRERVTFPIHNTAGKVVGFGARIMAKEKSANNPKYINSPETYIYHKTYILYGIYFAKQSMVKKDNCYLVEGYTDVISMHQAGIENVVASSGTALTVEQVKLIRKFTHNITVLFDGDAAGIKASFRGIDIILKEGMNLKVLLLPDGHDPDSFVRSHSNSETIEYFEKNAVNFILFKTNILLQDTNNDPIAVGKVIHEIINDIALIPDSISRQLYVQECAKLLHVSEAVLINELNKILRKQIRDAYRQQNPDALPEPNYIDDHIATPQPQKVVDENDLSNQERKVIEVLLQIGDESVKVEVTNEDGDERKFVQMAVKDYVLNNLKNGSIVLENPTYQQMVDVFASMPEASVDGILKALLSHENANVRDAAADIAMPRYEISEEWEERLDAPVKNIFNNRTVRKNEVDNCLLHLQLRKIIKLINLVQSKLKTATNEEDAVRYLQQLSVLNKSKNETADLLGIVINK